MNIKRVPHNKEGIHFKGWCWQADMDAYAEGP